MTSLPLILHAYPLDLRRGAQRLGRALKDRLDGRGARHRIVTFYPAQANVLDADHALDIDRSLSAKTGLDPRVALELGRLFRREQPAAVIAHGSEPLKYIALSLPPSTPVVYHRIGVSHVPLTPVRRLVHQTLIKRARRAVGVSEECVKELREDLGVAAADTQFIPNGRDPDRFPPRDHAQASPPVRLCFVGHLSATKRPQRFVRLVARLREAGHDVSGVLIGDGPMEQELRGPAAEAGVDLLLDCPDVPAELHQSDVFVFTSETAGEGMPGVLIEAAMCGLPIVTTDSPGSTAVVKHGETGFIVGVDDEDAMFDSAVRLVESRELRARFGAGAADFARRTFDIQRSVDLWHALLQDLLADTNQARQNT